MDLNQLLTLINPVIRFYKWIYILYLHKINPFIRFCYLNLTSMMIGRKQEKKTLQHILDKKKSSFVAVTGRRRIGKSYLIDNFFEKNLCFRVTGIQNATLQKQIRNFADRISAFSKNPIPTNPNNWQEVFFHLRWYLSSLDKKTKQVIFIDELPWIATARSGYLQLLAHLWNDYLSKEKHFILVVCGSASSWLTSKIVNDKGGLHNRITDIINLKPFNLKETKLFLEAQNISLNPQEIAKLYMTLGGVPFYLEQVKKGDSAAIAIERICFSDKGALKHEYDNLYKALFRNSDKHEAIVKTLAKKSKGLTRKELINLSKINAGGSYTRTIDDLLLSGFITEFIPFGKKKRGVKYRLNDEFSIFYHRFMKKNKKFVNGMWSQITATQSYKIWQGYAFENLCFKHIDEIKKAIGIAAVYTEVSSYDIVGNSDEKGFQIDLLIDRNDNVINLCEIKYHAAPFKMDKKYANYLIERSQRFVERSKTKKQIFNTLITNFPFVDNVHSTGVIDVKIGLDDIFDD